MAAVEQVYDGLMTCLYTGPFVLVGGAPRSGTSLLASVIAAHPDAAVLPEENLTAVVRALLRLAAVRVDTEDDARNALLGHAGSLLLEGGAEDVARLWELDGYRRRFAALLETLFRTASGRDAPKVLGSKMVVGAFWEDVDLLARVLGDLRLVLILRNPMDALSSSLARSRAALRGEDRWLSEPVAVTYRRWLNAMRIMAAAAAAPLPVLLVKYEDLCTRPAEGEARVIAFAGLRPGVDLPPRAQPLDRASLRALPDIERAEVERLLGPIDDLWSALAPGQLLERFGAAAPYLPVGEAVAFGLDSADVFLVSGFCGPEGWGRWTDGPRSHIRLRHDPPDGRDLRVDLRVAQALSRGPCGGMPLRIAVNGGVACEAAARAGEALEARVPATQLRADGLLEIVIDVMAPKTRGEPPHDDPRALGVAFDALRLSWAA